MKRSPIRNALSIVLALVLLGAIAWYLWRHPGVWQLLTNISVAEAACLILLRVIFLGVNGLFLKAFAAKFAIQLVTVEWFGLPFVTTMGNYLTPFSGGMLARATYLKMRHEFPYAQFATLLAANYLVLLWLTGVVGAALSLALADDVPAAVPVGAGLLILASGITLVVALPPFRLPPQNRLFRIANTALDGWYLIRSDGRFLLTLIGYGVLSLILNAAAFWLAFRALSSVISAVAAVLVSLSTVFSTLLNVTPGNFGIREGFISLTSELLGTGVGYGLLVALLIRASTLASAFTLGPLFSFWLAGRLGERTLRPPDRSAHSELS